MEQLRIRTGKRGQRWFIQGLGAYQSKDEPLVETPRVQEALLEAVVKAIQSALAQETLEEALPSSPSSAPRKPRF